jgi:uncharacterized phage infection (PIP) family protein YhgE
VVASVQQVNDIINRISSASDEQAEGIGEVNRAVGQMDDMTQQNAALVEEAAAAAASLHEQTVNLARAVSVFKIEGTDAREDADTTAFPALAAPIEEEEQEFAEPAERRGAGSPMRGTRRPQSDQGRNQSQSQNRPARQRSARG